MTDNTYYLVMHKWVNGNSCDARAGNELSMLNSLGRSCCLGQFALQKGVSRKMLSNQVSPHSMHCELRKNYDDNFLKKLGQASVSHSRLAVDLMNINDLKDPLIPDHIRAEMIKDRMEQDGLKLIILHSNY